MIKKPHTSTGYEPSQHISRKLRLISRPIEKILHCKNQAFKKTVKKKLYKVIRMKKKSCYYKSKLSLFCHP